MDLPGRVTRSLTGIQLPMGPEQVTTAITPTALQQDSLCMQSGAKTSPFHTRAMVLILEIRQQLSLIMLAGQDLPFQAIQETLLEPDTPLLVGILQLTDLVLLMQSEEPTPPSAPIQLFMPSG